MREALTLPKILIDALAPVGVALATGKAVKADMTAVVAVMGALDPRWFMGAERDIVEIAMLHRWRRRPSLFARLFGTRLVDADQLRRVQGLEWLFVFHRDGRLREGALRKMSGPVPNAFLFAAIAWRLNDWAEPVRVAAARCAAATFPQTSPTVIAEAALALLHRQATWGRWGSERALLDEAFARADVVPHLALRFATRPTGPMSSLLRQALRSSAIDGQLEMLAADATQPAVRAAATQALIEGQARWPDGWRWRWIDKSMGVRRRETAFVARPLSVSADRADAIRRWLRDRAASVRYVALAGLLRHGAVMHDAVLLAERALADRSPSIRARAAFFLEQARSTPAG